ncbi:unnamed protein product [Coregonus sp. 'balchen']|nr:unnamed protein product [Coregonus sp. 'balchen']
MISWPAGREWFIHTIYTVRSKDNANHGIGKRSLEYHHSLVATGNDLSITSEVKGQGHRVRRSASGLFGAAVPDVAEDIGADNNHGTNIMHIALDRTKRGRPWGGGAVRSVAAGREWFIHTIYTVRSKDNANHGIGKRSLEYHHSLVATGNDLSITSEVKGQGHRPVDRSERRSPTWPRTSEQTNNHGTNIMHIALDRTKRRAAGGGELYADGLEPRELNRGDGEEELLTVVGGLVGMLLTFLLIIILVLAVRSRQKGQREEEVRGSASTEAMMVARMDDCSNSSEV